MDKLNYCELTASVTALANVIASKIDDSCLDVVAAVFVQLGDTLATISAQKSISADSNKK